MAEQHYCEKCGRWMNDINFYTYKTGEKTELCKKCLTMHIDNFDEETFLWILEKMDVPYVPEEWNAIRDRAFAKNPNLDGMSVLGKYLSKMKLKQWNQYGWKDTEMLQMQALQKKEAAAHSSAELEARAKERYANGEISEAEYKTLVSARTQNEQYTGVFPTGTVPPEAVNNPFTNPQFMSEDELSGPAAELTEEDKLYLAMKWGRLYRPSEWIELEKIYTQMTESFDIQDADTINTLILICKTNLKMNQSLDQGDLDGFQKLSRVSESLRKSAKFTAAQNKEAKEDFVDSVGELVAYCEKNGGIIPKYEITTNLDIVDEVIADLKRYTKSLIFEDKALARQIEDYLKKREIAEQQRKDRQDAKAKGLDDVELTDEDYVEHFDKLNDEIEQDIMLQENGDDK